MREFLYVDGMAEASVHMMNLDRAVYDEQPRRRRPTSMLVPASMSPFANWRS
jgi:hypothetical protein